MCGVFYVCRIDIDWVWVLGWVWYHTVYCGVIYLSESKIKLVKYVTTTDTMVNLDFSKYIYNKILINTIFIVN